MLLGRNDRYATKRKHWEINYEEEKDKKSQRGWRHDERRERRPADTATLTCFTSAGMVQKNPPLSIPTKAKPPGETCVNYFLLSGKFSFPSSPPLVSSRFPGLFTLSFPSVSAEAAAQTQAAILYSAECSRTQLDGDTQEARGRAFQNNSVYARSQKDSYSDCTCAGNYKTLKKKNVEVCCSYKSRSVNQGVVWSNKIKIR